MRLFIKIINNVFYLLVLLKMHTNTIKLTPTLNNPNPIPFIQIKTEPTDETNEADLVEANHHRQNRAEEEKEKNRPSKSQVITNESFPTSYSLPQPFPILTSSPHESLAQKSESSFSMTRRLQALTKQNEQLKQEKKAAEATIFELKASLCKANHSQVSSKVESLKHLFETTSALKNKLQDLSKKFDALTKENERLRLASNKQPKAKIEDVLNRLSDKKNNLVQLNDSDVQLQIEKSIVLTTDSSHSEETKVIPLKKETQENQDNHEKRVDLHFIFIYYYIAIVFIFIFFYVSI